MGERSVETKRRNSGLYRSFSTDESIKARNDLVMAHAGLIAAEARKLVEQFDFIDMDVAYNALMIGALECMRSYDESRSRVSTWILTSLRTVKRDLTTRETLVPTPASGRFRVRVGRFKKELAAIEAMMGPQTDEQKKALAESIGIPYHDLLVALNSKTTTSIDAYDDAGDDDQPIKLSTVEAINSHQSDWSAYGDEDEEDTVHTSRYSFKADELSALCETLTRKERTVMGYMARDPLPYTAYTKRCKDIPPMSKIEFARAALSLHEKLHSIKKSK